MTEEIAVYEGHDLAISKPPEKVLEEARRAAKALRDVVSQKPKPVIINNEQYLEFEDWQTVSKFYGVTAKIVSTNFLEYGDVKGFEAKAVAVRPDGIEVSAAESMCLNDETNWKDKPLFQLRSMAQTRACAKALRNCFAWVVVLAGYRPTPAEEMINSKPPIQPPKAMDEANTENIVAIIEDIRKKTGGEGKKAWTKYVVLASEGEYNTFSESIAKTAKKAKESGVEAVIEFRATKYGNEIININLIEGDGQERIPGEEG